MPPRGKGIHVAGEEGGRAVLVQRICPWGWEERGHLFNRDPIHASSTPMGISLPSVNKGSNPLGKEKKKKAHQTPKNPKTLFPAQDPISSLTAWVIHACESFPQVTD